MKVMTCGGKSDLEKRHMSNRTGRGSGLFLWKDKIERGMKTVQNLEMVDTLNFDWPTYLFMWYYNLSIKCDMLIKLNGWIMWACYLGTCTYCEEQLLVFLFRFCVINLRREKERSCKRAHFSIRSLIAFCCRSYSASYMDFSNEKCIDRLV